MRTILTSFLLLVVATFGWGQNKYEVNSPDGKLKVQITVGENVTYTLLHDSDKIIDQSPLSLQLDNGKWYGRGSRVKSSKTISVNRVIDSPFYKRKQINDIYNELTLQFRENFSLIFRAYNEGMAYRFVSAEKSDFIVINEEYQCNFDANFQAIIPYVKAKYETLDTQYFNSFENTYSKMPLTDINPKRLMFTPVVVELNGGKKLCLAESDLESYPGMFLSNPNGKTVLQSNFAPRPIEFKQGGHNQLQLLVTDREKYVAKCKARTSFPWRIAIVATNDAELADSDMVYKLAAPSRVDDISWIKPGKVAWEWWNNWGISGVDFEVGINNQTYMAYIDFAARNGIEYVILDEGWSVRNQGDLFKVVPEINLPELAKYADSKGVGLILWVGYYPFDRDMENVCGYYSKLGIKGFKIDFMDRDDQVMIDFHYRAAETAARYKLLVNFHGTYKPTGINRTYPNVINFEAVHGLEQMKWSDISTDQVTYDVTFPFIRMVAGPIDYTQGAMRNGTKKTFRSINNEPMSQGTRCRQLAQYVVFESPLNMLCDSPNNYDRELECTSFITSIPTVWDNSIAMDGKIGQYIAMARCKDTLWYVGAMTNWDARTLELDLSFLGEGNWEAEIFTDGVNAVRTASDFRKEVVLIPDSRRLSIRMAEGGGCAMKISKK